MDENEISEKRLRTLALAHRVGGVVTLFTGFGLGLMSKRMWEAYRDGEVQPEQETIVMTIIVVFGVATFLCALHGTLMFMIARWIAWRVKFTSVYFWSAINAIIFPMGTLLFVYTAGTLSKDELRSRFNPPPPTLEQ